jgi:hypothetical protein
MAVETHQRQLSDEIGNVIDTLHGLFEEIGLARYDREQRESGVYAAISAALNEQLRVVTQYVLPLSLFLSLSLSRFPYVVRSGDGRRGHVGSADCGV